MVDSAVNLPLLCESFLTVRLTIMPRGATSVVPLTLSDDWACHVAVYNKRDLTGNYILDQVIHHSTVEITRALAFINDDNCVVVANSSMVQYRRVIVYISS